MDHRAPRLVFRRSLYTVADARAVTPKFAARTDCAIKRRDASIFVGLSAALCAIIHAFCRLSRCKMQFSENGSGTKTGLSTRGGIRDIVRLIWHKTSSSSIPRVARLRYTRRRTLVLYPSFSIGAYPPRCGCFAISTAKVVPSMPYFNISCLSILPFAPRLLHRAEICFFFLSKIHSSHKN